MNPTRCLGNTQPKHSVSSLSCNIISQTSPFIHFYISRYFSNNLDKIDILNFDIKIGYQKLSAKFLKEVRNQKWIRPDPNESTRERIAFKITRPKNKRTHERLDIRNFKFLIIVPTPLEGGGRNYILKWVFFVQSILADRYIHRRELRLVSLESLSSVEYGIKNIFLIFVLDREILSFKLSRK